MPTISSGPEGVGTSGGHCINYFHTCSSSSANLGIEESELEELVGVTGACPPMEEDEAESREPEVVKKSVLMNAYV